MEDFNGCPYSNVVALNDTLTILSGKWKLNIIRALLLESIGLMNFKRKYLILLPVCCQRN